MKYLIPIASIGISMLLVNCSNPKENNDSGKNSQTVVEPIHQEVVDTSAEMALMADTTGLQTAAQSIESASKPEQTQTKPRSNNDDLENEKFRIAELERRRKLALEANPGMELPDPKQVIAEEKARIQRVAEQKANLEAAKPKKTIRPEIPTKTIVEEEPIKTKVKETPAKTITEEVPKAVAESMPTTSPVAKPVVSTTVTKPTKQAPLEPDPVVKISSTNSNGVAKINFDQITFPFDTIVEGDIIDYKFKFVNTGTKTIEILNAKASCGCTRPSFPFLPIEPGQEGFIGVKYDSRTKSGSQTPEIEVITNFQDEPIMLYLKGYVKEKAE